LRDVENVPGQFWDVMLVLEVFSFRRLTRLHSYWVCAIALHHRCPAVPISLYTNTIGGHQASSIVHHVGGRLVNNDMVYVLCVLPVRWHPYIRVSHYR
jgi:hypothetical protein